MRLYFTGLFRTSLDDWEKLTDRQWLDVYRPETENLRAALEWLQDQGQWDEYADLCAVSCRLWLETGLYREGMSHCERALKSWKNPVTLIWMRACGWVLPNYAGQICLTSLPWRFWNRRVVLPGRSQTHGIDPAAVAEGFHPALPTARKRSKCCHRGSGNPCPRHRPFQGQGAGAGDDRHKLHRDGGKPAGRGQMRSGPRNAQGYRQHAKRPEVISLSGRNAASKRRQFPGHRNWKKSCFRRFRAAGYKLELGFQLNNLAAYHLADGDVDRAREVLLEAVEYVARDDKSWHWCLLQNIAAIEAMAGDARRAARLLGFVDRRFASFPDRRQNTEAVQRTRIMEQLGAAIPSAELAGLLKEGEGLSLFEADYLANLPGPQPDSAA